MKKKDMRFLLKLPDAIKIFLDLVDRLCEDTSGNVIYLSKVGTDGRPTRLNLKKLISLIRKYKLHDRLMLLCREVDLSCRSETRFVKTLLTKLSEYSVGITILLDKLRQDGYLTKQDLLKIREQLELDYKWYLDQAEKIKRLLPAQ